MPAADHKTQRRGHGSKPDAVREKAILALLSERSLGKAAERAGVGERTLRRWLEEDAAFKAQYDDKRTAIYQQGVDRLQALMARAVDTLEDLLGAVEYPAVRLGAARTVADLAVHQHGLDEIASKLAEIEAVQRQSHLSGGE